MGAPRGFSFFLSFRSKKKAQAQAEQLRKERWMARVVPGGLGWAVFRRRRRKKPVSPGMVRKVEAALAAIERDARRAMR